MAVTDRQPTRAHRDVSPRAPLGMTSYALMITFRVWLVEIPIAAFNAFVLMDVVYAPRVGDLHAHQIAMATRITWVGALAFVLIRFIGEYRIRTLIYVGAFWAGLWLAFEWGGSLLIQRPVHDILVGWHVEHGYMWPYVLLAYLLSPLLIGGTAHLLRRGDDWPLRRQRRRTGVNGKRRLVAMARTHVLDRWLYRGRRAHWLARRINGATARVAAAGRGPAQLYTLEVRGRRSGKVIRFPVVVAEYDGERYLVSMLGDDTNWVRNVRAADGRAVLARGHREAVRLDEVDSGERGAILRCYLARSPGAQSHIDISADAPVEDFDQIAPQYPIFRVSALAEVPA